jgi:hypothetical protein
LGRRVNAGAIESRYCWAAHLESAHAVALAAVVCRLADLDPLEDGRCGDPDRSAQAARGAGMVIDAEEGRALISTARGQSVIDLERNRI